MKATEKRTVVEPKELKLTEAHRRELARRKESFTAAPEPTISWEEVNALAYARVGQLAS